MHQVQSVPFNADVVKAGSSGDIYVGMYELEESERHGGLVKIQPDGSRLESSRGETCGVLDLRLKEEAGKVSEIWAATSEGSLRAYSSWDLSISEEVKVGSEEDPLKRVLMTLDRSVEDKICVISVGGQCGVLDLQSLKVEHLWQAHESKFESWCCAFDLSGNLVASGGDDCTLKLWDLRCPFEMPVWSNRKEHSMGVTSLLFASDGSLLSGSYDEKLRAWDLRATAPLARLEREGAACGGVWRIEELEEHFLIAGCYGGCEVMKKDLTSEFIYDSHKSMVYGVASLGGRQVASCSFYDRAVHVWEF